jgi:hypothetical protein
MAQNYKVTVSHVAAPWNGDHDFTVTNGLGGWPATSPDVGRGTDAPSPEAAIRFLGADNGGKVVAIRRVKTLKDFHPKGVPGLYNFDHFEAWDGSWIQFSPRGHGVYRDENGGLHEFDTMTELKAMFAEEQTA